MRKLILFSTIVVTTLMAACDKYVTLPPYTATNNFSVISLNHTVDSVSVGDTVWLTATGALLDTTKFIYTYLTSSYTASGVSSVYNFGTAASPIKLAPVFGPQNASGLYTWTSAIMLTGATFVPHKTKLTIVANFIYQLSLSSEQGTLSATDAGVKNKTVYVE